MSWPIYDPQTGETTHEPQQESLQKLGDNKKNYLLCPGCKSEVPFEELHGYMKRGSPPKIQRVLVSAKDGKPTCSHCGKEVKVKYKKKGGRSSTFVEVPGRLGGLIKWRLPVGWKRPKGS